MTPNLGRRVLRRPLFLAAACPRCNAIGMTSARIVRRRLDTARAFVKILKI
jgi:hypothetical protein